MEVVTRAVFSGPRMNCERLARGSGRLWRGCVARMRATDPVCAADRCGFGEVWRRRVALDGARNHRRHDDAKAGQSNSILLTFHFLFRQSDNRPERALDNERACLCSCASRLRDADAIAESANFSLFAAETNWCRQRSRKSFPRFAASFRTTGIGAIALGAALRSTLRCSLGATALDAKARRAIISSDAEVEVGVDGDCR
jgi:hypothetical protein